MNRRLFTMSLYLVSLGLALTSYVPLYAQDNWRIERFETAITIRPDSSLSVTETITVNFASPRHGIFRQIPTRVGRQRLDISLEAITDGAGNSLPYKSEWITENQKSYRRFRIGDPDFTVQGRHVYVIRYRVQYALGFFDTYDELYWNATGVESPVPIDEAVSTVTLPAAIAEKDLKLRCFTGPADSKLENCSIRMSDPQTVRYEARQLGATEGLTIVLGFPKNIVTPPAPRSETGDYWGFLWLPLITLAIALFFWLRSGRDPWTRRSIMPQWDPPKGLSPAEAGLLFDEKLDQRDISATLIDLAVRGYLKIRRLGESVTKPQAGVSVTDDMLAKSLRSFKSRLFPFAIFAAVSIGGTLYTGGQFALPFVIGFLVLVFFLQVIPWSRLRTLVRWRIDRVLLGAVSMGAGVVLGVVTGSAWGLVWALPWVVAGIWIGFGEILRRWWKGEPLSDEPYQYERADYELTRLKDDSQGLKPHEKLLLDGLFDGAKTRKLSEREYRFSEVLSELEESIYRIVLDKGYFVRHPNTLKWVYLGIGLVISFWGFGGMLLMLLTSFMNMGDALADAREFGIPLTASMAMAGLIIWAFAPLMARKTAKGVDITKEVLGLREYLSRAEGARLRALNAPDAGPEVFEKLLPYAISLGVAQAWSEQFVNLYQTPPSWYESSWGSEPFSTRRFTHSLREFSCNVERACMASAPSGSGPSRSGFSGGSSGAGRGGGGVGAW